MKKRIMNYHRPRHGRLTNLTALLAAALCLCAVALCGADKDKKKAVWDPAKLPPASDKKGVAYEKDIKPIFERSCVACHTSKMDKPAGQLVLDADDVAIKTQNP